MGGYFINYFNRFGRQWQVYIEAEGEDRARVENVGQFYVRNNKGEAVPLSTLTTLKPRLGPEFTCATTNTVPHKLTGVLHRVIAQTRPRLPWKKCLNRPCRARWASTIWAYLFWSRKRAQGVPPAVIFGLSLLFVFLDPGSVV